MGTCGESTNFWPWRSLHEIHIPHSHETPQRLSHTTLVLDYKLNTAVMGFTDFVSSTGLTRMYPCDDESARDIG